MKKFTKTMMLMAGACALGAVGMSAYDKKCNLKKQLKTALKDVELDKYQTLYIAYEPRYLINGKLSMSKKYIIDTFKYLNKVLEELKYEVEPKYNEKRVDIVQNIIFNNEEDLERIMEIFDSLKQKEH